jgi:hypothetical protein
VDYKVIFSVPANFTGTKDLGYGEDDMTITFVDHSSETSMNLAATKGKLEITTIDTTAGTITGKIYADYDSDNILYGNFSVTYCK